MKILVSFMILFFTGLAMAQVPAPIAARTIDHVLVISSGSIVSGQTVSAAIPVNGLALVGIQLPAAFTSTTLTFQISLDGTTYQPVYVTTTGTALSYTVAQAHYVAIDPVPFYGARFIKLVSGSAEGATRTLALALKGL